MSRFRIRTIVVPALAVLSLAGLLLGLGGVAGPRPATPTAADPAAATARHTGSAGWAGSAGSAGSAAGDQLKVAIGRAQQRLRRLPGDHVTWAALGSAYLEMARITAQPDYYPKAEGALRRSLALRADGNAAAMSGLGALANARHDFAGARVWAHRARAAGPYHADAYGVLADAETQLGNASAATAAVQRMLDLRPGLPALTRASYDLEQRGQLAQAREMMRRALAAAADPVDVAFCRHQLGELAWQAGDLAEAAAQFRAGLDADPGYLPSRRGQARVDFAQGRRDRALAGYAALTAAAPTPGDLLEYAELLTAAGRRDQAAEQLALADAALRLFTANGGADELTAAELALAERRAADAVRLAEREWQRRKHADVADTLAWALHTAGRDAEALAMARRANQLKPGYARYAYHLGAIELASGNRDAARDALRRSLDTNPYFSPLDGPAAARALATLEA